MATLCRSGILHNRVKQANYFMKDPLDWTLLSSEYIYSDSWFTARKDTCQKPDGAIVSPYYVLEYPDWACAMALTEDGKVVLVRQYRHAITKSILELPGGVIDQTDESPLEGVRRELLEETGYTFSSILPLGIISSNPSTNNNTMHLFLAQGGKKTQEQQLDHNEEIEVHLVDLKELKTLLRENKIVQSMHVTCLFYGLDKLGELQY